MKRIDNNALQIGNDTILLFMRIRNEELRLPWMLTYYRALGVGAFFIVDNHSSDGSTEYLLAQDDVFLFHTTQSYAAANYGMAWINTLLDDFAMGHWAITVDADEMLVYPASETTGLDMLTRYLDTTGADSLRAPLLDMYSAQPIREAHYNKGTNFLDTCSYFDTGSFSADGRKGPRQRVFWGDDRELQGARPPYLVKVPLVKWQPKHRYKASTHLIENATNGDVSGVLLHFKFFSDFHEKVLTAVQEGEYWHGSEQYAVYLEKLQRNPDLSAYYPGSVCYHNSEQLVTLGYMSDSAKFAEMRNCAI